MTHGVMDVGLEVTLFCDVVLVDHAPEVINFVVDHTIHNLARRTERKHASQSSDASLWVSVSSFRVSVVEISVWHQHGEVRQWLNAPTVIER